MKLSREKLFVLIVLCGVCGGANPTFAKMALESFNSGSYVMLRYILALALFLAVFSTGKRKINWHNVRLTLPVSIFAAVNAITFAIALRYVKASSAALLYNAVPLMVALLSWVIIKERVTWGKLIGLLIGFSGVMVVALTPYLEHAQNLDFKPLGVIVIFIGSIGFSFYSVLSKPIQDKVSPAEILVGSSIVILIFQALYMLVTAEPLSVAHASLSSWVAVSGSALIGTALFYGIFQYVLKASSPVAAASMTYAQPIAGALWALIFLSDRLSFLALVGGLVSLIGIAQVNGTWADLRKRIAG